MTDMSVGGKFEARELTYAAVEVADKDDEDAFWHVWSFVDAFEGMFLALFIKDVNRLGGL